MATSAEKAENAVVNLFSHLEFPSQLNDSFLSNPYREKPWLLLQYFFFPDLENIPGTLVDRVGGNRTRKQGK